MVKRPLVILPTFNEAESLPQLIEELGDLPRPIDILVVDDSSPDGTSELVAKSPGFGEQLFLLQRKRKSGFASAYKDGYQWALERDYDVCLGMDSDLSHDPKDILRLLEGVENGADMVVGSRYFQGISVVNWPLYRLLMSIGAGIYVRTLTGLRLTDPTSGFSAIRRTVIESLDWDQVTSEGYGFLIEVKFFVSRQGFRLQEIPIVFTERRDGQSKFSGKIIIEAVLRALGLGVLRIFQR
ncbi:hypothetical protein UR09_03320 [Candidatus Nitromaritima sp. SCGC AAA799-A02]|nr:hypothetical protein UR09_03320 [Candidatus Nitromaritima sp. SCGC AAA799-A02]